MAVCARSATRSSEARRGNVTVMLGPYIHNIDPIVADVGGVHLWWYRTTRVGDGALNTAQ